MYDNIDYDPYNDEEVEALLSEIEALEDSSDYTDYQDQQDDKIINRFRQRVEDSEY